MNAAQRLDTSAPDHVLLRLLRRQPRAEDADLPESTVWQVYCELRRRGHDDADRYFLRTVKSLHRRRSIGTDALPVADTDPTEHKLVDDPMLAELWKAYKRCICSQRTGPAGQLLRDIEAQLATG